MSATCRRLGRMILSPSSRTLPPGDAPTLLFLDDVAGLIGRGGPAFRRARRALQQRRLRRHDRASGRAKLSRRRPQHGRSCCRVGSSGYKHGVAAMNAVSAAASNHIHGVGPGIIVGGAPLTLQHLQGRGHSSVAKRRGVAGAVHLLSNPSAPLALHPLAVARLWPVSKERGRPYPRVPVGSRR